MLLVTSLLATSYAQAAGEDARERAARKACMAGDYVKGVDLLADLFVDTKDPTHIYNKGRCYEQNSRHADAIGSFREYLRHSAKLSSAEKADAEKHIADCETLLAKQEGRTPLPAVSGPTAPMIPQPVAPAALAAAAQPEAKPAEPQPTSATAAVGVGESPSPVPLVSAVEPPSSSAPASSGRGFRIAGIACGAVGLASMGTAIYFYTRATSMSDKVSDATTWNASNHQAGKDAGKMQWVFYSAGGAALAAGAVLYLLGWSAPTGPANVAVAPLMAPGTAGVSAQGVF